MEEKAFMDMVKRQRDLIWHVCSDYRLSAAWTVEDAFQEVLAVLWRDWPTFDGRCAESSWVWRVATNTMLRIKRKTGNQPQEEAPLHDEPTAVDENLLYLWQLVNTLKDKEAFIVRCHLEGFSNKEIAVMVKLPVTTVAKRLSRGKKKLRHYYENGL